MAETKNDLEIEIRWAVDGEELKSLIGTFVNISGLTGKTSKGMLKKPETSRDIYQVGNYLFTTGIVNNISKKGRRTVLYIS